MAKFAKTTEIDISAMHEVVEVEPPKRSKWFTIIPIILSIVIAFGIWIYVTENSRDINTIKLSVAVEGTEDEIELEVSGTNSNLADFDKSKLEASFNGEYYIINYNNGKLQETTIINDKNAYISTTPGISFVTE